MAPDQNAGNATPTFHEAVFKGSPKALRGLLTGLALGSGVASPYWFHDEADIADPGAPKRARRVVEKLRLVPAAEVRVVVGGGLAALLRRLRRQIAASGVCELDSLRRIKTARAALRYHTYAKRYDDEVQILLRDLPRGVTLEAPTRTVRTDPHAQGVEVYSPAHEFESRGGGVLAGRFDLVIGLRDRLDVHPLIECDQVDIVVD
ncbi:MAG TPA: hypothetical protein PLL30_10475 [Candidatus Krumholzibacteria bacterium]|nr:hypothetical protein [Candidatus Krumholzibacteria bacterium]HPD72187.1 hypothetical protein [Candidatus Krumholzibacteria bacterium]HRY40881.1 hypothetical protein [Candidatus Krumholzibacteria bacterium]